VGRRADACSHRPCAPAVTQSAPGCEAGGVRGIANPSGLDIAEHRAEPAQVEAALLGHVLDQVAAAGGQHGDPLPAQFANLRQPRPLPVDLRPQSLGHPLAVGEMQKEHGAVKRLPEVAFSGKLRVQQFTKAGASARSDALN